MRTIICVLLLVAVVVAFGWAPNEKTGKIEPTEFGKTLQDLNQTANQAVGEGVRTQEKIAKVVDKNLVQTWAKDRDSGKTYDQLYPPKKEFTLQDGVVITGSDGSGWQYCRGPGVANGVVDEYGFCIKRR